MISRKKKWRGDQGLLELRARAVYIINEKKMVKSRRWKDLSSVIDPGDFVLLNSPTSDRREILKVAPPIIQYPTGPASFFPWGKPMTYALTSQQPASGITVHVAIGENWGARDPDTLGEASFSFFFFLEKH